ncbi:hypothetical protein INR49_010057 [Caranx melampygus]|nr:hypothetical protein INR49_010057 [Caranx melampygus]
MKESQRRRFVLFSTEKEEKVLRHSFSFNLSLSRLHLLDPRRTAALTQSVSLLTVCQVKGRRAESESGSPGGSTLQLNAGRKISTSLQHFHRPDNGTNIYRKPPIYKQDVKHLDGSSVIKSAKFPAAQPPDPNQPSKIETEYWPCPPSLAAMANSVPELLQRSSGGRRSWRRRRVRGPDGRSQDPAGAGAGEDQVQPGTLILKEEKEKEEKAVQYRRKTQSLPDRTHMHTKTPVPEQFEEIFKMPMAEFDVSLCGDEMN